MGFGQTGGYPQPMPAQQYPMGQQQYAAQTGYSDPYQSQQYPPAGGYGAAAPQPPKKGVKPIVWVIIVIAFLLVVAGSATIFFLMQNKDDPSPQTTTPPASTTPVATPTETPTPTPTPTPSETVDSTMLAYCAGYLGLESDTEATLGSIADSSTLSQVTQAINDVITLFSNLQALNPPEPIATDLTSVITYFTTMQSYIDAGDADGLEQHLTGDAYETGFEIPFNNLLIDSEVYCINY